MKSKFLKNLKLNGKNLGKVIKNIEKGINKKSTSTYSTNNIKNTDTTSVNSLNASTKEASTKTKKSTKDISTILESVHKRAIPNAAFTMANKADKHIKNATNSAKKGKRNNIFHSNAVMKKNTLEKRLFDQFTVNYFDSVFKRDVSFYALDRFKQLWRETWKRELAKNLTKNSIIPANGVTTKLNKAIPNGKVRMNEVKLFHGKTYGKSCLLDLLGFINPDHAMLFRTVILVARNPHPVMLEKLKAIATKLAYDLEKLGADGVKLILQLGSNPAECRSQDFVGNNINNLLHVLKHNDEVAPETLLRALEVILSPIGIIAHGYKSNRCKLTKAELDKTINSGTLNKVKQYYENIMPFLSKYHTPYAKCANVGSPKYNHLVINEYNGSTAKKDQFVTQNIVMPIITSKGKLKFYSNEYPSIRQSIVTDKTDMSKTLYDCKNLPHFFNVSGTTGAIMQSTLGYAEMAGTPAEDVHDVVSMAMLLAGCSYTKQGYHTIFEVYQAVEWVLLKVFGVERDDTPHHKLAEVATKAFLQCMDPNSEKYEDVKIALDLLVSHCKEHYEESKKHERKIQADNVQEIEESGILHNTPN